MRTLSIEELATISGNGSAAPPFGGFDDGPKNGAKNGAKGSKKS